MDQMLTLETKIDKFEEEEEEEHSYDEEEDEDLGSEIGDTIDVNDVVNKQGLVSQHSSKNDLGGDGEDDNDGNGNGDESDEMIEESRSREQRSGESIEQLAKNGNNNDGSGEGI